MSFQTSIRTDQATGVVGDLAFAGPIRAIAAILNTTTASNNVIGRAFTHVSGSDTQVAAGGTGAFAGILFNSKEYTTAGPSTGALDATMALPNNIHVELLQMGYVLVSLSNAANIGDDVHFVQSTGALLSATAGATPSAGNTKVPNATVVFFSTTGAGVACIRLTN